MSNPIFDTLNQNNQQPNIVQQFLQFKNSFNGDPKQQVQNMLNSGQMTQEQFNQLSQQATQLQKMFNL